MQCPFQEQWVTRDVAKRLQKDFGSLRAGAGRRRTTAETVGQRKELAKLAVILGISRLNESWPHCERAKETQIQLTVLLTKEDAWKNAAWQERFDITYVASTVLALVKSLPQLPNRKDREERGGVR